MVSETRAGGGELLQALKLALERKRHPVQEGVLLWASSNSPRYPWRQPGKTPYEVFLGEFWLKETTPAAAISVYEPFLKRFPSVRALAEVSTEDVKNILASLNLKEHAYRIKQVVDALLREGRGGLPRDSESFLKASGFEPHIIRIIMCFGYNLPVAVIDANVARMLFRLFEESLPTRPPLGLLGAIAESLLPGRNPQRYNSGLLDIAELICRDEDKLCGQCSVIEACDCALSVS